MQIGELWQGAGRPDAAERAYARAVEASMRPADTSSADAARESERLQRYNKKAWKALAMVQREARKFDAASATLGNALAAHPKDDILWGLRGDTAADLRKTGPAVEAYLKAAELDPADGRYPARIGELLCAGGQRGRAMAALEDFLDRLPAEARVLAVYNRCRQAAKLPAMTSYTPRAARAAGVAAGK